MPDFLREPDHSLETLNLPEAKRLSALVEVERESAGYTLVGSDTTPQSPLARRQLNDTTTSSLMVAAFPPLPYQAWVTTPPTYGAPDPQLTYTENIPGHVLSKIQQKWHPLHTAEYLFSVAHLPNLLLGNLGDRGEMAHSIEGRTPFLDHKLTGYVNSLPPSMKIRYVGDDKTFENPKGTATAPFIEKWILREAARPYITDEIYSKKKHPYSAPVVYPVGGPMHRLMKRLVTKDNVDGLGFVVGDGIEKSVEKAFKEQKSLQMRGLFLVASFVVLAKRFHVKTATDRRS